MNSYDLGQLVRCPVQIVDLTGAPVDPGTLTFTIEEPDGTETVYVYGTDAQLVRLSAGSFYVDWPTAQSGTHFYRYVSTVAGAGALDSYFGVLAPLVTPA